MLNNVSLGQVEQLAVQLPIQEQLKLLSRLSGRLTETISLPVIVDEERRKRDAAAVLRACDRAASAFERKTDSAETIRCIRDERCGQLC